MKHQLHYSQYVTGVLCSPQKPRRKKSTDSHMMVVMDTFMKGMSMRRNAEEHAIPRSTLEDRILGNVVLNNT